jgi:hypothetical protein
MQNNNFHKKHLRGSSSLQETEKRPDESVTLPVLKRRNRSKELPTDTSESVLDNWVRGLRSIRENQKDSLRGDQREELTAQEHDTGSQSDDERWQDDGGESGEVV